MPAPDDTLALAIEVHDRLAKLVAPASPESIGASSLLPRRNLALFLIALFAGLFFAIFITPIVATALEPATANLMTIIGAAGLGSAFYALHSASTYITAGTFDPKYNSYYIIRFGLGILAGVILAYFLRDLVAPQKGGTTPISAQIGVGALALLGGYSAEAVAQILDRISESLVTLVSGGGKDQIDAARDKAETKAENKIMQHSLSVVRKLQLAAADSDPKGKLRGIIDELSQTQ